MTVQPRQLVETLARRNARVRVEAERRAQRLRDGVHRAVRDLAARGVLQRAWLIGSLATGAFGPGSDVDIVVGGLDPNIAGRVRAELEARLAASVDLVRLEEIPDDFRRRVHEEGIALDVT